MKLVTDKFFYNEKHEKTRKNFMEEALTARMHRYTMKFFRVILRLFVVKKNCHPVSLTFYRDALYHGTAKFAGHYQKLSQNSRSLQFAVAIADAFLNGKFEGERHAARVGELCSLEV